jgi:hypothetical protein
MSFLVKATVKGANRKTTGAWSGVYLQGEKKARPAFLKKPWFSGQKTGFSRVGGINNKTHICRTHYKHRYCFYYDEQDNPNTSAAACSHAA